MSNLKTNLTSLEALVEKAKNLPEASSGEDVTEETNTYTSLLTELETAINELPDAGSGGGVETCTVVLNASSSSYRPYYYSYTTVDDNGNITGAAVASNSNVVVTLNNVVCGSVVTVYWYTLGSNANQPTNATRIVSSSKYFNAFLITAPAGGNATIANFTDTSGGGN